MLKNATAVGTSIWKARIENVSVRNCLIVFTCAVGLVNWTCTVWQRHSAAVAAADFYSRSNNTIIKGLARFPCHSAIALLDCLVTVRVATCVNRDESWHSAPGDKLSMPSTTFLFFFFSFTLFLCTAVIYISPWFRPLQYRSINLVVDRLLSLSFSLSISSG